MPGLGYVQFCLPCMPFVLVFAVYVVVLGWPVTVFNSTKATSAAHILGLRYVSQFEQIFCATLIIKCVCFSVFPGKGESVSCNGTKN